MSAAGQPIDPVMALAAQQQAPAPMAAPMPQSVDPVQALASGQFSVAGSSPPVQSAPQQYFGGNLSDYLHAIKNGADLPSLIGETGMDLGAKGTDYLGLTHGAAPMLQQTFKESNNYGETDPNSKYSQGGHMLGNVLATLPAAGISPITGMAGRGIAQAGADAALQGGLGTAVTSPERNGLSATETGQGALLGGAVGTGGYALGKMLSGASRSPAAQLLSDEGVRLTLGQGLGGTAHTLENSITQIPMLGNAIKGRQGDAITDFNRAVYNRVLGPLGVAYDKTGPVGNEGIQNVGNAISDAYDKAYRGATIQQTPKFSNDLVSIIQDATDVLPKDRVDMINKNINTRLISKFNANGDLSNDDLINAKNWFAEQARVGPNASTDEGNIATAHGAVVDAIKDAIAVNDPTKGALLDAADQSHMLNVKVGKAASENASSGRGGIFTPAQLGNALRTTDQSTRRMDFAKGIAPMQDLVQAGQQVLPSDVPDSGTAIRGLMQAAPFLAGPALVRPAETAMLGSGLAGATSLYSRPGQSLARALLHGAPGARKAIGALPQAITPGLVAALLSQRGNTP